MLLVKGTINRPQTSAPRGMKLASNLQTRKQRTPHKKINEPRPVTHTTNTKTCYQMKRRTQNGPKPFLTLKPSAIFYILSSEQMFVLIQRNIFIVKSISF